MGNERANDDALPGRLLRRRRDNATPYGIPHEVDRKVPFRPPRQRFFFFFFFLPRSRRARGRTGKTDEPFLVLVYEPAGFATCRLGLDNPLFEARAQGDAMR